MDGLYLAVMDGWMCCNILCRSFLALSLLLQTGVWGDVFNGAVGSLTASGILFAVAFPAMISAGLLLSIHIYLICTNQVRHYPPPLPLPLPLSIFIPMNSLALMLMPIDNHRVLHQHRSATSSSRGR